MITIRRLQYAVKRLLYPAVYLSTFVLCFLFSPSTSAISSTITLTVANNISLNIVATQSGAFSSTDTSTPNVSITTNHATGYTLGILASANDNSLVNTSDNTKTIPSIATQVSPTDYANSSTLNNTYGYMPSKYHSSNNTNYLPTPTDTVSFDILDSTSLANPSTANNYNIAIGARVDDTITPGSYTNTFIISAIANPTTYSITYNQNTTDTVTNMPTNVSDDSTYDETVTLSDTVPARSGLNFGGWCTAQVADDGVCTGTTYNPNGAGTDLNWQLDQTASSNVLTLYAMWSTSTSTCTNGSTELYCMVESVSKGTQSVDDLKADLTATNSGVFEYDSSVFGQASDISNSRSIYYFRGILDSNVDSTTSTYGSRGDGLVWQNYVRLGNTCWRIVRTTGSGGVKMIYNGMYGDTFAGSCANATTKAQTRYNNAEFRIEYNVSTTSKAGKTYTGIGSGIHASGYTYSNVSDTSTWSTAYSNLFGATGNDTTTNGNSSVIKKYIDDWYTSNLASYTSILETGAGYCNDRTLNTSNNWTTPVADNTSIQPYKSTGATVYYFGPYVRNVSNTTHPTLTCSRGTVDTYSTTTGDGGNGQLTNPIALLTLDEAAFAGSGVSEVNAGPTYNFNSFLHSKNGFWLMSPSHRTGAPQMFYLGPNGKPEMNTVNYTPYGVRPVISLAPGTEYDSGTGTATNPWIVSAP